jgi:hypothetical protein
MAIARYNLGRHVVVVTGISIITVEVGSALAGSIAARAAVGPMNLGSDRIGILPAAPLAAEAQEREGSALFGIGLTPWAQGGWNGGCTSIQPRGAAADPVDLAQAWNSHLDRGRTPASPRAPEAQEALKA